MAGILTRIDDAITGLVKRFRGGEKAAPGGDLPNFPDADERRKAIELARDYGFVTTEQTAILLTALATVGIQGASVLAAEQQTPQTAPAKAAEVEGITEYRLPNGLRVLLFPDQSKPTITVNMTCLAAGNVILHANILRAANADNDWVVVTPVGSETNDSQDGTMTCTNP